MNIIEDLSEEEAYLFAILMDQSGIDQCEFSVTEPENDDMCFRCWPFQWAWWRCTDTHQIDVSGRSIGKSLSIEARAYAFPFIHSGDEMVITAPEGVHLDAITDRIETMLTSNRLSNEMLIKGRGGIKHRPFMVNFTNGSRIMGRIPQHDGKGTKGCLKTDQPVLTKERGYVTAGEVLVGDELLNDQGKWTKVRALYPDVNDCYRVEGAGSYPVEVSCDHRFLGAVNEAGPKEKRDFKNGLNYHDVEFLLEDHFYWATPTEFPHVDPIYPEITGKYSYLDVESEEFWWLVGLYVADGYVRNSEKTNKPIAINWISHPENKGRKKLIRALDKLECTYRVSERSHSSADQIENYVSHWAKWLEEFFGRTAKTKVLPTFMLSLPESFKESFLDGYLMGDGHYNEKKNRWECSSASKELMMMMQLLAQSIGLKVAATFVQPEVSNIMGVELKEKPQMAWKLHMSLSGHSYEIDTYLVNKVKKVTPIGKHEIVNILVEDGHSYLGGSIMNHNIHPIWLEMDESQDYPDAGWVELMETLKTGHEGAVWRAHGVTRGLRDHFFKFSQPNSGWTTHRFTAIHRPTWSDEERDQKIQSYGSRDNPDFRRNIYGFHGDSSSPIFILNRLMQCVDIDDGSNESKLSEFNSSYFSLKIDAEMIKDGTDILSLLNYPAPISNYWIGADIGYTTDPTEILVFKEELYKSKNRIALAGRIQLKRINANDQADVVLHLLANLKPIRFAMDRTGNGLPLLQVIQGLAEKDKNLSRKLDTIVGFNFSENVLFGIDDSVEIDEHRGDLIKEAGIYRKVLECSTDVLREFVDEKRLLLPYDKEVIGEFTGQSYTYNKAKMDMYGRARRFSTGSFHTLDAARMAALAYQQYYFKMALDKKTKKTYNGTSVVML